MFYFVFIFFTVFIFIVLLYVGVVLMGMSDFRWKTPPLPPEQIVTDADHEAKKVDEFLTSHYDERFEVRSVNGRFHICTTPDCTLPDETILDSLTATFPKLVFRISRSLFDSAAT